MMGSLLFYRRVRRTSGYIDLAPGEGYVEVPLEFEPSKVKVCFTREPNYWEAYDSVYMSEGFSPPLVPPDNCEYYKPSCVDLEDEVYDVEINGCSFSFRYIVETGIRTVKWKARR